MQDKADETKITSSNANFEETKAYLQKEYNEIMTEKAVFYSIDEVELKTDELIAKYKNCISQ